MRGAEGSPTTCSGSGCPGSVRTLATRFTGIAKLGDVVLLKATLRQVEDGVGHYALQAMVAGGGEIASGSASVAAAPAKVSA